MYLHRVKIPNETTVTYCGHVVSHLRSMSKITPRHVYVKSFKFRFICCFLCMPGRIVVKKVIVVWCELVECGPQEMLHMVYVAFGEDFPPV